MLISIALTAIAAAALLRLAGPSLQVLMRRPAMATSSDRNIQRRMDLCEDRLQWDPARVSYGCTPGARVFGWPAKGGLYVHTASAVEIEFLGYERFKGVPRPSPTDPDTAANEESHCNKMRQLGAVWWESETAWLEDKLSVPSPHITKRFLSTGWPGGGGVWVLSTTEDIAAEKNAGMLFNAYNMEERCKWIEQLGGTFYADPKDCPDLDLA